MGKRKVAVVGANGYSGEELLVLLSRHPGVEITLVTSRRHAGSAVGDVIGRLRGVLDLDFAPAEAGAVIASGAEFVFLALPHGLAVEFAVPLVGAGMRVIDLSADFRLRDPCEYARYYGSEHPAPDLLADAVYGMPETHGVDIAGARLVASPGCYPTSAILPLMPLLREGVIEPAGIVVHSASGVSGAGRKAVDGFLFAECNENMRAYGLPSHRHLPEIRQELALAAGGPVALTFLPHLLPVTRGIHTTAVVTPRGGAEAVAAAYGRHLGGAAFVRLLGAGGYPELKDVTHTNFLDVGWHFDAEGGKLVVLSAEDNLIKGAGGQAIQSMNLMAGWPEETGLP